MLNSIKILIRIKKNDPFFQFYDGGVGLLYFRNVGKVDGGFVKLINIYFSGDDFSQVTTTSNSVNADCYFDFALLKTLADNKSKKQYILDTLHGEMLRLCKVFSWDPTPFVYSYNRCLEQSLELTWLFKGKLFRSPDRKLYFGLFHVVDIEVFEIFEVIYDSNKKEIARRLCFTDSIPVFRLNEAFWSKDSKSFYYKFKGPQKVFEARVEDIRNNLPVFVDKNTGKFFKIN